MSIDAETLKALVERELEHLSDARVLAHIRTMLAEPEVVFRAWDYGKPGDKYLCWTVRRRKPELLTANMASGRAALGDWYGLRTTRGRAR